MLGFQALGRSALGQLPDSPVSKFILIGDGSFSLTGNSASLVAARTASGAAGTFTLTGSAAVPRFARATVSSSGSFSLSGQTARLVATRHLTCANSTSVVSQSQFGFYPLGGIALGQGIDTSTSNLTFSLTGHGIHTPTARRITVGLGVFLLSGQSIIADRFLGIRGGFGSYAMTGNSAGLRSARMIHSGVGVFTQTGKLIDMATHRRGMHVRPGGGAKSTMVRAGGGSAGLRVRA